MTYQPPPFGGRPMPPMGPPPGGPAPAGPAPAGPAPSGPAPSGPAPSGFGGHGPQTPPGHTGFGNQFGSPTSPYGPGPYGGPPQFTPNPPPRPPRGNGAVAAVVCGVVALLAIAGLIVTIVVKSGSSDGDSTTTAESTTQTSQTTESPDSTYQTSTPDTTTTPGGSYAEVTAIRDAMQNYINAGNARDLARMQAAVCSENRRQVTLPTKPGNIILEGIVATQIDGDYASTQVLVHVEEGGRRSTSEPASARFLKENSQWLYCPGAEPSIGT